MRNKFTRFVRSFFFKRKQKHVEVYLSRFENVDKFLGSGLIAIDLQEKLVVLDASIHIAYMDNDRVYAAFFDTLRAYMNYRRGLIGMAMIEYKDKINFIVILKEQIRFDETTGEVFSPAKENPIPLIVGFYQNGGVDYAPYEEPLKINSD